MKSLIRSESSSALSGMSRVLLLPFRMSLLLVILIVGASGEKARFDDHWVLRLFPENDTQVQVLRELEMSGEYDFWTPLGRVNGSVDILVSPDKSAEFEDFLDTYEIPRQVQIENVQRLIDGEGANQRCIDMSWDSYHRLEIIYEWMDEVSKKYPFVKKVLVGKSYEGRKIKGLEIAFQENATGVFIESGMHGREWITPAATTWMVKQILDSPGESVFRNFTYYYIPVFNPDGYSYTWTHNRLWKKTRTPYKRKSVICYGADPNRNWDFRWKEFGESDNPCSEAYPGPFPFSEIEIKSISSYLKCLAHSRNVDIYVAYRSYSQLLHYPWQHDSAPAPQQDLWQRIGEEAAEDLRGVHGTEYAVGGFSQFFEPVGGASSEWFYGMHNSSIAYTFAVRDTGDYGFLLPSDQIVPTGEELLASLETILMEYQELNITRPDATA